MGEVGGFRHLQFETVGGDWGELKHEVGVKRSAIGWADERDSLGRCADRSLEGGSIAPHHQAVGLECGHAPVVGLTRSEVAEIDGGGVGGDLLSLNEHVTEGGIVGNLQLVGGTIGSRPSKLLIPRGCCASDWRNERHLVGIFGGEVVERWGKLIVPAINHTHGIPVARLERGIELETWGVGHAHQIIALDAVERLTLRLVEGDGEWHGIHGIAHEFLVHARPREGATAVGEVGRRVVVGLAVPRHGRLQRLVCEERLAQIVGKSLASGAVDIFRRIEIHARGVLAVILAAITNLLQNLVPIGFRVGLFHKINVMARIVVTAEMLGNVAPPVGERTKWIGSVVGFPIELWRDIVDGALFEPRQRVAVDGGVLPVAGAAVFIYRHHAMLGGRCGTLTSHAGRTDREFHIRLGGLHHVPHVFHHLVHVGASPVADAHTRIALGVELIVGGGAVFWSAAAWVEIVIEDDAVDVVVLNHFLAHLQQVVARGFQRRVEHDAVAHLHEYARIFQILVDGGVAVVAAAIAEAIGIHPRIDFQTTLVTLLNGKRQRVPTRVLTTSACKITRPWLVTRFVECISHRAHLQAHRVHVGFHKAVEQVGELLFLFVDGGGASATSLWPVDVADCGNPYRSHFAFLCLLRPQRQSHKSRKG